MINSIEELKEIIKNAPEGATHCDNVVTYYKMDSHGREWGIFKGCWCVCVGCNTMRMSPSMRSLSDLAEILKLNIENEQLKAQIEQICNEESDGVNDV